MWNPVDIPKLKPVPTPPTTLPPSALFRFEVPENVDIAPARSRLRLRCAGVWYRQRLSKRPQNPLRGKRKGLVKARFGIKDSLIRMGGYHKPVVDRVEFCTAERNPIITNAVT